LYCKSVHLYHNAVKSIQVICLRAVGALLVQQRDVRGIRGERADDG
jgi:hypothetical protein